MGFQKIIKSLKSNKRNSSYRRFSKTAANPQVCMCIYVLQHTLSHEPTAERADPTVCSHV